MSLSGKKVAFLTPEGAEQIEPTEPGQAGEPAGSPAPTDHEVVIGPVGAGPIISSRTLHDLPVFTEAMADTL